MKICCNFVQNCYAQNRNIKMQGSRVMNRTLLLIPSILFCSLWMAACDTTDELHRPEEQRTMIIGGVPAHDQDYKLTRHELALNEPVANGD
jgi:hypothetical protein